MNGEEMYQWFENELKQKAPQIADKLAFSYEPTVTPGVYLAKISASASATKAIVRSDVRPEGVRLYFPLAWQENLSEWLGVPPADAYRLKSNWVHQPSIGVSTEHFDPHFKQLGQKVIELLAQES